MTDLPGYQPVASPVNPTPPAGGSATAKPPGTQMYYLINQMSATDHYAGHATDGTP